MTVSGCRYLAHRVGGDESTTGVAEVIVRQGGCDDIPLPPRLDLFNHSPDGFNWGYGGSGPAQLALAILAHALGSTHLGDQVAIALHQRFKKEIIAPIHASSSWSMGRRFVVDWVEHARRGDICAE